MSDVFSPAISELVWRDALVERPDDLITVLVGFDDGEMDRGYYDSKEGVWRSMENARFVEVVQFWADCPAVPIRGVAPAKKANLVMAGDIEFSAANSGEAPEELTCAVVIECEGAAQVREAMATGRLQFTVFAGDPFNHRNPQLAATT